MLTSTGIVRTYAIDSLSATIITVAAGEPFFWALVGTSSGVRGYARKLTSTALSTQINGNAGSFTPAILALGDRWFGAGEFINGNYWNVRVWDAILTERELMQESLSPEPLRLIDLHAWWPLEGDFTRLTYDRSGNGRHLTRGGNGRVEPFPFPRALVRAKRDLEFAGLVADGVEARTLSSAGVGATSLVAVAFNAQTLTSVGAATVSLASAAFVQADLSAIGAAAVSLVSSATVLADLTSAGVATVTLASATVLAEALTSAGVATVALQSLATNAQTLSSAGQATVSLVSTATNAQTLTSAGQATVSLIGEDAAGGIVSRTLSADGTATVSLVSTATAQADLNSAGAATVTLASAAIAPVVFTAVGVATVNLVSTATAQAALSAAGTATVNLVSSATAEAALAAAGVATVNLVSEQIGVQEADLNASGSATVNFIAQDVGQPDTVVSLGGSRNRWIDWPGGIIISAKLKSESRAVTVFKATSTRSLVPRVRSARLRVVADSIVRFESSYRLAFTRDDTGLMRTQPPLVRSEDGIFEDRVRKIVRDELRRRNP